MTSILTSLDRLIDHVMCVRRVLCNKLDCLRKIRSDVQALRGKIIVIIGISLIS